MKFMKPCFPFYAKISTIVRINIHLCIIKLFDCSKYEVLDSHDSRLQYTFNYLSLYLLHLNLQEFDTYWIFYTILRRINMQNKYV